MVKFEKRSDAIPNRTIMGQVTAWNLGCKVSSALNVSNSVPVVLDSLAPSFRNGWGGTRACVLSTPKYSTSREMCVCVCTFGQRKNDQEQMGKTDKNEQTGEDTSLDWAQLREWYKDEASRQCLEEALSMDSQNMIARTITTIPAKC